jgi:hypothetical protein
MQVGNRYRRSDRRRWLNTTLVTGLIGINAWLWAGIMFGTVRPPAVDTAWLSLLTLSSVSALVLAIGVWGRSSMHHRRMLSVPALRQAWATHQAGHLVATYLADPDRLRTTAISDECPSLIPGLPVVTESAIRAEMRILFGGVAAEEIFAGESGSHASGDLARASSIAAAMVGRYGMAGSPVSMMPAAHRDRTFFNRVLDDPRTRKDLEVILREIKQDTVRAMLEKRHAVIALRDALLRKHRLQADEIRAIIAKADRQRREHNEVLVDLRVISGDKGTAQTGT